MREAHTRPHMPICMHTYTRLVMLRCGISLQAIQTSNSQQSPVSAMPAPATPAVAGCASTTTIAGTFAVE